MKITYDERKRVENLTKHDADFFAGSTITTAKNGRFMAIGYLYSDVISTVYATLGTEGISIISMRPSSRKERETHETT